MATNPYFSWADRSAAERFSAELARASRLNDVFDEIAGGFDIILASPAFTGVPTAPTPALSTNTTQIPTTAWVNSLIGSLSVGLPSQLTHSGKYLTTNGTSASWALPIASQTGNSGKYLTTNGTADSWARLVGFGIGGYSALTTSTILSGAARTLDCTSATYGQVFRLPDATTLDDGEMFAFGFAASTTNIFAIEDSTGALISSNDLGGDDRMTMYLLTDNGTAAGTWKRWRPSTTNGFEAMPSVPQVIGPNTTTLASGTHVQTIALGSNNYLCVGISGTTINAYVLTIAAAAIGPATITKGTAVTLAANAASQSRLVAINDGYAFVYTTADTSGVVKACPLSVSGTTVTIGTLTTIVTLGANFPSATGFDVCATGGTFGALAVFDAATTIGVYCLFVGGGVLNVSSRASAITGTAFSTSATQIRLANYTTNKFLLAVSADDNGTGVLKSVVVNTSAGPAVAANTSLQTSTSVDEGSVAVAVIDSTKVLIVNGIISSTTSVRVASMSGDTITHNGAVSLGNNTGTSPRAAVTQLSSTLYAAHMGSASVGHLYSIGVSGTTPSVNGSALASVSFDLTAGGLSYDGTNVAVAASSTGGTLYSVTSGGISVLSSALDANLLSGGHGGVVGTGTWFRTSLTKTYVLIGRSGTAQVYRYAGVA